MKSICPAGAVFDPPLGHKLAFKAVMFQGMKSGDEVVMSIKVSGCLDEHDCHVNSCLDRSFSRFKRNAISIKENEISEVSKISFRIVLPGEAILKVQESQTEFGQNVLLFGGILGAVGLLSLFGLLIYLKKNIVSW